MRVLQTTQKRVTTSQLYAAIEKMALSGVEPSAWVNENVPDQERHTADFVAALTAAVVRLVHGNEPPAPEPEQNRLWQLCKDALYKEIKGPEPTISEALQIHAICAVHHLAHTLNFPQGQKPISAIGLLFRLLPLCQLEE